MGQRTSELWDKIFRMRGTIRQYQFDIAGTIYGPESEVSHSVSNGLYEEFGIGNASSANLTISFYADDVPRSAVIRRYIRLKNEDAGLVSEWIPKGVFYTNRRTEDDGLWTIDAFDALRRAERLWVPLGDESSFPMPMPDVVNELAAIMEIELDPRTRINPAYSIQEYPYDDNYTIRDVLRFIAAAHGGNWTVTDEGKLFLVPLFSAPQETGYLVTEYGSAITLGGVRLIVDKNHTKQSAAAEGCFAQYYAGLDLTGLQKNSIQRPVTKVTLAGAADGDLSAGDDTGMEISAECPYATSDMVNAILGDVYGCMYWMYSADDVNVDPAMELGDGITLGGIYSVIARVEDDGCGWPSLSQPGKTELEDEYPYESPEKRKRKELEEKVDKLIKDLEDLTTSSGVISFNGRTGVVVPEVGDYTDEIEEAIRYAIYESWKAEY